MITLQFALEDRGFSFHEDAENGHWYCWCGPHGGWEVESGDYHRTLGDAVDEAWICYTHYVIQLIERAGAYE